jgi:hypothetical protein
MVRLPIEQSQIWNFRLLLTVKPDSMLVPTFSFDVLLIDSKLTTFHNVLAACNDIHHISVKTTSNSVPFIHSPWRSLLPPWPIKWHTFMLFILGDPATPNSTSVGSPLLTHGHKDFINWQNPLQPYQASSRSSSSLQLVSSCGDGKPSAGSFLTG